MIGTTVITTTGTPAKTAPTGVTWRHSTGGIVSTTGSTTERSDTTGIGATAIRTAISKGRERGERLSSLDVSGQRRPGFFLPGQSARLEGHLRSGGSKESGALSACYCVRGQGKNPARILLGIAAEPCAPNKRADLALRSARGAVLQFLRNLDSPFHVSLPLLIYRLCSYSFALRRRQSPAAKIRGRTSRVPYKRRCAMPGITFQTP
jgi:hypothetical protein